MSKSVMPAAAEAVALLGELIAARRRELSMTAEELALRVGTSPLTLRKIERGDTGVAIGTAFTAAAVLRLPLFGDTTMRNLAEQRSALAVYRALLPERVRVKQVDDDF